MGCAFFMTLQCLPHMLAFLAGVSVQTSVLWLVGGLVGGRCLCQKCLHPLLLFGTGGVRSAEEAAGG